MELSCRAEALGAFLSQHGWMADCWALDFFADDVWSRVPAEWRDYLAALSDEQIAGAALAGSPVFRAAGCPESLRAFAVSADAAAFPRSPSEAAGAELPTASDVWRGVKGKKRHELPRVLSSLLSVCSGAGGRPCVVDVGCGKGHLTRAVAHLGGVDAVGVDSGASLDGGFQGVGTDAARAAAGRCRAERTARIGFVDRCIEAGDTSALLSDVGRALGPGAAADRYVLCGLHACGSLSVSVLRSFVASRRVAGVVSVGCCYHRVSEDGYPLSRAVQELGVRLSAHARDVAGHAAEARARDEAAAPDSARRQCWRAVLELHLRERGVCRAAAGSVRGAASMTFDQWCGRALQQLGMEAPAGVVFSARYERELERWRELRCFMSLRAHVAKCIESLVVADRALWLREAVPDLAGLSVVTLFDPLVSPRNLAIVATRDPVCRDPLRPGACFLALAAALAAVLIRIRAA
eukprot:TRINITY_DN9680_c1_g1_i1.p1 TRINITY_DN9680_c1_g1~~TRINITY_DN9680_c1_g1_i1.p1  ORF type:complete len:465 (+),score=137.17 TRINITY_DN9680_c1_g1_i1:59-1453(+)